MTSHAFFNDWEIRRRNDQAAGVLVLVKAPQRGSWEQVIELVIEHQVATQVGLSVFSAALWDFMKVTWSAAIGQDAEPTTPRIRRLAERREPYIGEIGAALEGPLEEAHRPIQSEPEMRVSVRRPRAEIVRFDVGTLDYVSSRTESEHLVEVTGNVTRYNVLSGYGRFYDDELERTIGFQLRAQVSNAERTYVTWSMHEYSQNRNGKITLMVNRVVTRRGEPKHYLVSSIARAGLPG